MMEHWEFLIQRAGDQGWRPIKTGNLQLAAGKYRIVASSSAIDAQIHTRVTYQNLGSTLPQRKSQTRNQTTNGRGLVVIIPFTELESGVWQFVCSSDPEASASWHRILKLRVLPVAESAKSPIAAVSSQANSRDFCEDIIPPTAPIMPMDQLNESESWADGLDRLLEQLEQDSLKPRPSLIPLSGANLLQLTAIDVRPSRLISLDRSIFSGMIPGNRLAISGTCNLKLFSADLVQKVKISRLLICLRHPQTAGVVISIEHPITPDLEIFAFNGQIQLPIETTMTLLMGEVNLYDRHNIQIGTTGFTVTIDLNPIHESELSFLELFDDPSREEDASNILDQLTRELQLETLTAQAKPAHSTPNQTANYPSVPVAYRRESLLSDHPEIIPVQSSATFSVPKLTQSTTEDVTGDLDLIFDSVHSTYSAQNRHWDTLEVVVD